MLLAAVSIQGAAARVSPARADCGPPLDGDALRLVLRAASYVVIATVERTNGLDGPSGSATLAPEAYLKGPAQGTPIEVVRGPSSPCSHASLVDGGRVLAILPGTGERVDSWPPPGYVWHLEDGSARSDNPEDTRTRTETALVDEIGHITGQEAVAAGGGQGAGIDWLTTVVPIAGALVGLLVVGVLLLRIWHRIEVG